MTSKFSAFLLLPAAVLMLVPARGQGPFNPPVPLVPAGEGAAVPGDTLRMLVAAQRAQELGLPVAIERYRQLLAAPPGTGGDRTRITLALTTVLLNQGEITGAEEALQSLPAEVRGSTWHLRAGLIAAHQKKLELARAELAAVKPEELPAADVGWWYFLQGMIANIMRDPSRSLTFYGQAEGAAQSAMQRARFQLAKDEARIKLGTVSQGDIDEARARSTTYQGQMIGYGLTREYAIMLDAFGQKGTAMEALTQQLRSLPPDERHEVDEIRLLMGLIGGAREGAGRNALIQLLTSGTNPEKQRAALQLLEGASLENPLKADFRRKLDELMAAPRQHLIYEDLLVLRAQLALEAKDYLQAEKDAQELLLKFPGSQLKAQALGILASAAWEDGRYRPAASSAQKVRDELRLPEDRQTHAEWGLLIAEAWFRAEDFGLAADAYTAVLNEPPAGVAMGMLMYQRVLAEIKAAGADGQKLRAIEPLLDGLARDPAFDAVNRWKAEWNLARTMLVIGGDLAAVAYARANKLLDAAPGPAADSSGGAVPAELRARMEWLRARLSLEAGQPEQALRFAENLMLMIERAGLDPKLRTEIASTTLLLKAQAYFALGRDTADIDEVLKKLRTDFRGTDAAVHSYINEADYYEKKGNIVDAERRLTNLAGEFPQSTYAPYALLRGALLEKHRGQEANLREAYNRIETLIRDYPQSEWIFAARFEQGDILRSLNEFPSAQNVYETISRDFPRHPDVLTARLALAACHAAQADATQAGEAHADRAKEIYDQLLPLRTAPLDLRVEAGFNLGLNFVRRGDVKRAEDVWWTDVITQFLIEKPPGLGELGTNGRVWMSRTLLELGDLYERQGRLDAARDVRTLIVTTGLPAASSVMVKLSLKPVPSTP